MNVPDARDWSPSLSSWLCTGREAVEAVFRMPSGVVAAIDSETPSVTDSFTIKCVTAAWQGEDGRTISVLLDPARRPDDLKAAADLCGRAGELVLHNSAFDVPGMVHAGVMSVADVAKVTDTLVYARSAWNDTFVQKNLEALCAKLLGVPVMKDGLQQAWKACGFRSKDEWFAKGDIGIPFYRLNAMADTIYTLRVLPVVRAAAVDRQLSHPFGPRGAQNRAEAIAIVDKAQRVNRITLRRSARGYERDLDYLDTYRDSVDMDMMRAAAELTDAGLRPGNGDDLVKRMDELGLIPPEWPRTEKTQKLSAAKENVKLLDHPLATAHRVVDHGEKILGYLEKTVARSMVTGRVHPQVNILGASATGRMCLPVTHGLVTKRGVVSHHDIRIGDMTLDMHGQWVSVTAVHRYENAPITTREWRNFTMQCTSEHRWVTHVDGGRIRIEPISGVRRRVVLVPSSKLEFDPTARVFQDREEHLAALIGMLVSDGRCVIRGSEMRAYVYQTEGGFYREFLSMIPRSAVMYDRVTSQTGRGAHHEIRIKTHWLRRALDAEGLNVSTSLARSDDLVAWVARSSASQCRAFLQAVWLADGTTAHPQNQTISCEHPETQRAVQLAAYRLGWRSYIRTDPASEWGTKPRMSVKLTRQDVWIRNTPISESVSDVWCVSTASGTFTAWNGAPYLTGNSISEPELQQFPAAARPIIIESAVGAGITSVDWSSIEPAILAWAANDVAFIEPFEHGSDLYRPIQVSSGLSLDDAGRGTAKTVLLAQLYGQSLWKMALRIKKSTDEAKVIKASMFAAMPECERFMGKLKAIAEQYKMIPTLGGRILTISMVYDKETGKKKVASYKAVNSFCQGSNADLVYEVILSAEDEGWADHLLFAMHDELLADTCVAGEVERLMQTPPEFFRRWTDRRPTIRTDRHDLNRSWAKC